MNVTRRDKGHCKLSVMMQVDRAYAACRLWSVQTVSCTIFKILTHLSNNSLCDKQTILKTPSVSIAQQQVTANARLLFVVTYISGKYAVL